MEERNGAGDLGRLSRKGLEESLLSDIIIIGVHRVFAVDVYILYEPGQAELSGRETTSC